MTRRLRLLSLFTFVGLTAICAFAQVTTTGEIHGSVLDPASAVMPNVKLRLEDESTAIVRETLSGKDGGFVFVTLPNRKARSEFVSTASSGLRNALLAFTVYQAALEYETPLTGVSSRSSDKP